MSRVSHFQRFSQPENHATNNTLLVLRYFYQSSPFKVGRVLGALIEADLSIGLAFEQQVRGDASVPDALIAQDSMRIFIETKRGGFLDEGQIRRHLQSIAARGEARPKEIILIGLTKEAIDGAERAALTAEATAQGVTFAAVTFSQVVEALRAECAPFERELASIVDDYESYLSEEGLLEERNQYLVVFPCGTSVRENVRFGTYYEPQSRPCKRNYRFIGVYTQKAVAYIGAVQAIALAAMQDGEFNFIEESGVLSDDLRERIVATVRNTPYYDLAASVHRYYLVDSFLPTNARKISPGGIMGMRYLDLTKALSGYNPRRNYSTAELADMLASATWE